MILMNDSITLIEDAIMILNDAIIPNNEMILRIVSIMLICIAYK